MKNSKRAISFMLAILMIFAAFPLCAYAATHSGTISGDVTINAGDTIAADAVFNGNVTIKTGATVSTGKFNGNVTLEGLGNAIDLLYGIRGGEFNGTVTNNGCISSGSGTSPVFNGNVSNNGSIVAGTFNSGAGSKSVTNNAQGTISGGTFNVPVTNNGSISGGTFNNTVTNNSNISLGTYNGKVVNASSGSIKGGAFYNIIDNQSGTVGTTLSALILENGAYRVQNIVTLKSKVNTGSSAINIPAKNSLTIDDEGELSFGGAMTVNGSVTVHGKLVANSGASLANNPGKKVISVYSDGSFSGIKASAFDSVTRRQYKVKIADEENSFISSIYDAQFEGETVTYSSDWATSIYKDCYTFNQIIVYKTGTSKRDTSNVIFTSTSSSDKSGTFTMPAHDVTIEAEFTESHNYVDANAAATCTKDGFQGRKCSRCGKEEPGSKVIPALGHSFGKWSYDESSTICRRTCSRCGTQETNTFLILFNVDIVGINQNKTVTLDRKSTVTLHATFANGGEIEGAKLYWVVNDGSSTNEIADDGSHSITLSKMTTTHTVSAKITYPGKESKSSATETINIRTGFGQIIIAFFKGLFGKLPVYDQNQNKSIV